MRIKLKGIDLKENTLKDIANNNIDVNKFVDYITERLDQIYTLTDTKMETLNAIELYNNLKKIFNIYINEKDYLKVLSKKYKMHYTHFINIKTNMIDNENKVIDYIGASTPEIIYYDGNRLDLKTIRKITKNNNFLVVKENRKKDNISKSEKYENHQFVYLNIDDDTINEESELFLDFIELLKKDILVKDILYALKQYMRELLYQAKCITSLSQIKKDPHLAAIGKKYEDALNQAYIERENPKNKKISVRLHKDIKYRGK